MASPPLLLICLLHSAVILGQRQALAFYPSHSLLSSSACHGLSACGAKRKTTTKTGALYSSSSNDNDNLEQPSSANDFKEVNVAGVSVSPTGFLVLLQSTHDKSKSKVAFPISLTSSHQPDSSTSNTNNNNNTTSMKLPSLFQENNDQTSVTSPEALTFLQLLNGVDMATPILPPDTLSLICVWYAFLLLENDNGHGGGLVVEDELGLSTNDVEEESSEFQLAFDYIRAMVKTTLPPISSSDDSESRQQVSYMDASSWQRAKVQLPRAWLHGVRLQELADSTNQSTSIKSQNNDGKDVIGRVPIQFILECSVDDGSKLLEIPLLSIPLSLPGQEEQTSELQQQEVDISNEILQELSQNYNTETSAAFLSLALFHRYNKSGAASADSPMLTVSDGLLSRLQELQEKEEDEMRYCWVVPSNKDDSVDNDIDTVIQSTGLPLYRTMSQVQEEDQRVLQHLKEQNFGKNPTGNNGNSNGSDKGNSDTNSKQQQPKQTLTLEQQAMQQTLKSAWKIATQRNDKGALEKIQKAMEDLEKTVMENATRGSNIDPNQADEGGSTLQTIQGAMQQRGNDAGDNVKEEEVVGLISELEEATISRMGELDTDDDEEEEE